MKTQNPGKITTFALVLLITGAIDSIRNLPATALFGTELLFFFILAAVFFLIPVALVSAELSAAWVEEESGIFHWLDLAFGEVFAFIGIWLQWINTLVWYPTALSFIAGTAAYLMNPELANDKTYLISLIIGTFWFMTLINLKGLKTSARFASICALLGMILPMGLIIGLGLYWVYSAQPLQLHFTAQNMIPTLSSTESWVSLTAIMTSFLGMELAAVHITSVEKPQKNYPRAVLFSVLLILFTMICGSLAIAIVLPKKNIHLVDGVMQTFQYFFHSYHADYLLPTIIVLLLIGSLGGMINWIISPAKGLLMASKHGFLPKWLTQVNSKNVPQRILILQAVFVTLLGSAFLALPNVNSIYWLFTDLSTELYILMYALMFIAAIRIKSKYPKRGRPFKVPFGKVGYYTTCVFGLVGCLITLIIGFFPPEESIQMSGSAYRVVFTKGIIAMLLPALLICLYKKKQPKNALST